MEEVRTKGIVIDSQDYKEYDKILTIFTYDLGVIKAVIKGVKKSTAKSRFAGQLFCFIDIIMSKRGEYYTIISCDLVESYFEIAYNYDKFVLAVDIIKVIKYVSKYNPDSSELFLAFVSILNVILKTDANLNIIYTKFLCETLKILGYKHEFGRCDKCQKNIENKGYINIYNGLITCEECKTKGSEQVSIKDLKLIEKISNLKYIDIANINIKDEEGLSALKVVQALFKINCN